LKSYTYKTKKFNLNRKIFHVKTLGAAKPALQFKKKAEITREKNEVILNYG